jgi:ribosomal protein L44E
MLRCEECGKQARTEEEARRWRAYLTVAEEDEPEEVVVYCPNCAHAGVRERRGLT